MLFIDRQGPSARRWEDGIPGGRGEGKDVLRRVSKIDSFNFTEVGVQMSLCYVRFFHKFPNRTKKTTVATDIHAHGHIHEVAGLGGKAATNGRNFFPETSHGVLIPIMIKD